MTAANQPNVRTYDIIGFGDEVPGVLALVSAAREYRRRMGRNPRTLLMFKGYSPDGIGGHLVRGGLAYLDRCQVPLDVRRSLGLPTFGDPSTIYQEFLQRAGVNLIALDPRKADAALRKMLSEAGTDILSRVAVKSVTKQGAKLTGINLTRGETYVAKQFIDSTVNAELAQLAGVRKHQGFGTFGLPDSELPVTLAFETEGLSVQRLQQIELAYLRRFTNPNDREAQNMIKIAAGSNPTLIAQFKESLVDSQGRLKTMYVGQDYIDFRCRALSIAYQAFRGKKFSLAESGAVLDQANVAILSPSRLSWNALLFYTKAAQVEALAQAGSTPTPEMLEEMRFVEKWFKSIGATTVKPALELYIRHAGNVVGVVELLSGSMMLEGGVSVNDALGTFGYHLDVRGGIEGLGTRAAQMGIERISFHTPPLFNIGIQHALVKDVPNLAVVSPASGFSGYACGAGRIIEFNVGVGQGVGIAASLAILSDRNLANIANWEVKQVLAQTRQLPRVYGRGDYWEASRLLAFESALISDVVVA